MPEYHDVMEIALVTAFTLYESDHPTYKDSPGHWLEDIIDG